MSFNTGGVSSSGLASEGSREAFHSHPEGGLLHHMHPPMVTHPLPNPTGMSDPAASLFLNPLVGAPTPAASAATFSSSSAAPSSSTAGDAGVVIGSSGPPGLHGGLFSIPTPSSQEQPAMLQQHQHRQVGPLSGIPPFPLPPHLQMPVETAASLTGPFLSPTAPVGSIVRYSSMSPPVGQSSTLPPSQPQPQPPTTSVTAPSSTVGLPADVSPDVAPPPGMDGTPAASMIPTHQLYYGNFLSTGSPADAPAGSVEATVATTPCGGAGGAGVAGEALSPLANSSASSTMQSADHFRLNHQPSVAVAAPLSGFGSSMEEATAMDHLVHSPSSHHQHQHQQQQHQYDHDHPERHHQEHQQQQQHQQHDLPPLEQQHQQQGQQQHELEQQQQHHYQHQEQHGQEQQQLQQQPPQQQLQDVGQHQQNRHHHQQGRPKQARGNVERSRTPPLSSVEMKGNAPWTPEEDSKLREAVSKYSLRHWKKIARYVPGRTPVQCLQHYKHVLHPGIERGAWTPEEDKELIRLVGIHGQKWANISSEMPRRLGKRIRERYVNHLDPSLKTCEWTADEERILVESHRELGPKWSQIAKYLPGRSVNSVKNRWSAVSRGRGVLNGAGARGNAGLAGTSTGATDIVDNNSFGANGGGGTNAHSGGIHGEMATTGGIPATVIGTTGCLNRSAWLSMGGDVPNGTVLGAGGLDGTASGAGNSVETTGLAGKQPPQLVAMNVGEVGQDRGQENRQEVGVGGADELGLAGNAEQSAADKEAEELTASVMRGAPGSSGELPPSLQEHHHHHSQQHHHQPHHHHHHYPPEPYHDHHQQQHQHSIMHQQQQQHHHQGPRESPLGDEALFVGPTARDMAMSSHSLHLHAQMLPPPSSSALDPRDIMGGGGSNPPGISGLDLAVFLPRSSPPMTPQRWTEEQSAQLRLLVEDSGPKDWTNIAKKIPPKTDLQCMLHWNHVINPELTKGKGSWRPEEDQRILELVSQCGHKWSVIAARLKMETGKQTRVGKQIRERYLHHLNPNLKKGGWTQEEEETLVRQHAVFQNKWAQIAKSLPGRCDNEIKNHWYTHQRRQRELSLAGTSHMHINASAHPAQPDPLPENGNVGRAQTVGDLNRHHHHHGDMMAPSDLSLPAPSPAGPEPEPDSLPLPPAKRARTDDGAEDQNQDMVDHGDGVVGGFGEAEFDRGSGVVDDDGGNFGERDDGRGADGIAADDHFGGRNAATDGGGAASHHSRGCDGDSFEGADGTHTIHNTTAESEHFCGNAGLVEENHRFDASGNVFNGTEERERGEHTRDGFEACRDGGGVFDSGGGRNGSDAGGIRDATASEFDGTGVAGGDTGGVDCNEMTHVGENGRGESFESNENSGLVDKRAGAIEGADSCHDPRVETTVGGVELGEKNGANGSNEDYLDAEETANGDRKDPGSHDTFGGVSVEGGGGGVVDPMGDNESERFDPRGVGGVDADIERLGEVEGELGDGGDSGVGSSIQGDGSVGTYISTSIGAEGDTDSVFPEWDGLHHEQPR